MVLDKEKDDEKRKVHGYFVFHGVDSSNAGSSALLIRRAAMGMAPPAIPWRWRRTLLIREGARGALLLHP
ncbi:hypothetical protein SAMN05216332_11399 [Nitrosospira briensis]|nr:hypothetical protein SAMN05216332_11399 [Nitrosospira briensis]